MDQIWQDLPNDLWLDILKLQPHPTVHAFMNISLIKPELFQLVVHHHKDNQLRYFSGVLVNSSLRRYHEKIPRERRSRGLVVIHEFTFKDHWDSHGSELINEGGLREVDCFVDDLTATCLKENEELILQGGGESESESESDHDDDDDDDEVKHRQPDQVEVLVFNSINPLTTLKTRTDSSFSLFPNSYSFRNLSKLDFSLGYGDASNPNDIEYVSHLEDNDMYPSLRTLHISSYITLEVRFINLNTIRELSLDIHNLKSFQNVNVPNLQTLRLSQKFYVTLESNLELSTPEGRDLAYAFKEHDLLACSEAIELSPVKFPRLQTFEARITDLYFLLKYPFMIKFLKATLQSPLLETVNVPIKIPKNYYTNRNLSLFMSLSSTFKEILSKLIKGCGNQSIEEYSNIATFDQWSSDHLFSDVPALQSLNALRGLKRLGLSNITLTNEVMLELPLLEEADLTYTLNSHLMVVNSASLKTLRIKFKSTRNRLMDIQEDSQPTLRTFWQKVSRLSPHLKKLSLDFTYILELFENMSETEVFESNPFFIHHRLLEFDRLGEFAELTDLSIKGSIFEISALLKMNQLIALPKLQSLQIECRQTTLPNQSAFTCLFEPAPQHRVLRLNAPQLQHITTSIKRPKMLKRSCIIDRFNIALFQFELKNVDGIEKQQQLEFNNVACCFEEKKSMNLVVFVD